MTFEFKPWQKIPRLNREIIITEKIDGTNAAVIITEDGHIGAQSRNRIITPTKEGDNFGFATWVALNAEALIEILGPGYHYGEWWGHGIQRGYGLDYKRFSLFNVSRWGHLDLGTAAVPGLGVVPVLYKGGYGDWAIDEALSDLDRYGSRANPGFDNPEGIVVFHTAANSMFKVTIEGDEQPKSRVA